MDFNFYLYAENLILSFMDSNCTETSKTKTVKEFFNHGISGNLFLALPLADQAGFCTIILSDVYNGPVL